MNQTSSAPKQSILIVDDTPANLQLLGEMLKEHNYHIRMARSGTLAIQAAQHEPPDLLLLDIAMPEMDGYEVCARFKADSRLREIPVIFISALSEPVDKVRAFGIGGVEYLTKPFHASEVVARVRTQLDLQRQRRELQEQVLQLRELANLRDNLTHMIVHDLRSPLSGIMGGLELLEMNAQNMSEMDRKCLSMARSASHTLAEMFNTLLDVTRLETNQMPLNLAPANLPEVVRHGIMLLGAPALARCDINTETGVPIVCDQALLVRVTTNLVSNAIKFSPEHARVRVEVATEQDHAIVQVIDLGPGIPAQYHAHVFEKFGQVELRRAHQKASVGLGLAFCKLAVEAHKGQIGLESAEGKGSTFWFKLPLQASAPTDSSGTP